MNDDLGILPPPPKKKRIKIQQKFPLNQLFDMRLVQLHADAKAKGKKSAASYWKALTNLRKYKLELTSPTEAKVINGVGDSIVSVLKETLEELKRRNGGQMPTLAQVDALKAGDAVDFVQDHIAAVAAPDEAPRPSKRRPAASSLGSSGGSCASSSSKTSEAPTPFVLFPGGYDILLLVDHQERRNRDHIDKLLAPEGVEWRTLPAADFAWVARNKDNPQEELVLDFLVGTHIIHVKEGRTIIKVERKRMDDLRASLVAKANQQDRWRDQKVRMKNSGVSNLVLLVEDHGLSAGSVPLSTLQTAINNAQVHEDFRVVHTSGAKETMVYLRQLGRHVRAAYADRILVSSDSEVEIDGAARLVSVAVLAKAASRSADLTVADVWTRQVPPHTNPTVPTNDNIHAYSTCQLTGYMNYSVASICCVWRCRTCVVFSLCLVPRLTVGKAAGVAEVYPTPGLFLGALDTLGQDAMAAHLEETVQDEKGGKLGKALSKSLVKFFSY